MSKGILTVFSDGFIITSMLSSFEVLSSSIQNKFNLSRKKAVTILCIVGALLSMVFATAPGEFLVTVTDEFVNNISLVISVFFECLIFSWIFNMEKLVEFFNSHSKAFKIGNWWILIIRYIIPIVLIVIWLGGVYEILITGTQQHLILLMLLTVISLIMAYIFTKLPAKSDDWLKVEERIK